MLKKIKPMFFLLFILLLGGGFHALNTTNTSITYPSVGATLGLMASNCNLTVTIETNDTGGTEKNATIYLYSKDSLASNYTLLDSFYTLNLNASHTFLIPTNYQPYRMLTNATIYVDNVTSYSQNVTFEIVGTTFCTDGFNDTNTSKEFFLLGLVVLGLGMTYIGLRGVGYV